MRFAETQAPGAKQCGCALRCCGCFECCLQAYGLGRWQVFYLLRCCHLPQFASFSFACFGQNQADLANLGGERTQAVLLNSRASCFPFNFLRLPLYYHCMRFPLCCQELKQILFVYN